MKGFNFYGTTTIAQDDNCPGTFKTLRDIKGLLTLSTRRNARVDHEPGTVEKCTAMLLSMSLLGCSADGTEEFGMAIQGMIHELLCDIKASPDPMVALDRAIASIDPENSDNVFTVHRTTLMNMIPNADRIQFDKVLENQALECLNDLEGTDFKRDEAIQIIDDTSTVSHTKYKNANQSYIHVGQQNTWERGLVFPGYYDATHQLFMGVIHRDSRLLDDKKKEVRPWLQRMFEKCDVERKANVNVKLVEGDRYYFMGEFFAAASLGLLDPGARPGDGPRVITPRKFTRKKDTFKWNYLTDETTPEVFLEYIRLSPYTHPGLKNLCEGVFDRDDNYCFMIPYACVAVSDEYSKKRSRSVGELKAEAKHIRDGIVECKKQLEEKITTYQDHYKGLTGKKIGKPAFGKGRKRRKFVNAKDKKFYKACFKTNDDLKRWKKKKEKILKSLMFFAISLKPGEDPSATPSKFIDLARYYHERWCIENGFRDVKQYFLAQSRSRRPVRRTFFLVAAMMMYNRWQVERRAVATRWRSRKAIFKKPPDESPPWIRPRIEKECSKLPTAVGFLVSCWRTIFSSLLKKVIKREK